MHHPSTRGGALALSLCVLAAAGCRSVETVRGWQLVGDGFEPPICSIEDPTLQEERESVFVAACSHPDADEREPVLLPGGGLAFTSDINGNVDIWYGTDVDQAASTRLTHSGYRDSAPTFIPPTSVAAPAEAAPAEAAAGSAARGTVVYFVSDRAGRPSIWEDHVESRTRTPTIISRGEGTDKWPAVNGDGTRLLYTSRGTAGGPYRIYLLDLDSNRHTSLVDGYKARWHPTENKFVYSNFGDGHWSIYVYDLDTARQTNLSAGGGYDEFDPVYSPDGRSIAYTTNRPYANGGGLTSDVWVMGAAGSDKREVVSHPAADCEPCWNADGTELFVTTSRRGSFDIIRVGVGVAGG